MKKMNQLNKTLKPLNTVISSPEETEDETIST